MQHGLAAAEGTRDETRAAFGDRIQRVDATHTRLHHFEGTWFLHITAHGHLDGPFLHHRHLHFLAFRVSQCGNGVRNLVLSSGDHILHGVCPFEVERHHDFVGQPAFLDFAQPVGGNHLVARLGDRREVPKFLFVEGLGVFTAFQKHAFHGGEVVLQAVEVARKQTRSQGHLKHVALEFHFVANLQAAGALKHLHGGLVPVHFDDLCHQLDAVEVDEADLILCHRAVHLHSDEVCNDSCNFSCCFHMLLFLLFTHLNPNWHSCLESPARVSGTSPVPWRHRAQPSAVRSWP